MSGSTPGPERDGSSGEPTLLLERLSAGDAAAAEDLLPLVYDELRSRAGAYFRGQPANHTLQPTALVHEAYVKLVRAPSGAWRGRAHFCAVAATAMRQILVDHARRRVLARDARAREGARTAIHTPRQEPVELLALDEALTALAALDERQARLVELRYFGGLGNEEIADVLGVSPPTVVREWRKTKAWLVRELEARTAD